MSRKHAANRIRVWPALAAKVQPYQKAAAGALTGGLAVLFTALGNGITSNEWWQIIAAAAAGSGLVYAVPNKDPKAKHQDESTQPPPPGHRIRKRNADKGLR